MLVVVVVVLVMVVVVLVVVVVVVVVVAVDFLARGGSELNKMGGGRGRRVLFNNC